MSFDAEMEGFHLDIEGGNVESGKKSGPGPKVLILTALCGCTALDVISILEKMREKVDRFQVKAVGETALEHPKKFTGITLFYAVDGENVELEKVQKAVSLSIERYCGVYATLIPSVNINIKISINGIEQN